MHDIFPFVLLGLAAGVLSGILGIGGAIVIIPALVYLFGFPQHRAEGTTLALMVPPIGILAVIPYFKRGYVDIRGAGIDVRRFPDRRPDRRPLRVGALRPVLQKLFGLLLSRAAGCCSGEVTANHRAQAGPGPAPRDIDLPAGAAACCESGTLSRRA